jgi:hypothetical protein
MQENPDKKTPKPNSKWQQKFTHAPHLPTQGDLSLRKETLGSPARCTDMISYTLSIFQNNKTFVFDRRRRFRVTMMKPCKTLLIDTP